MPLRRAFKGYGSPADVAGTGEPVTKRQDRQTAAAAVGQRMIELGLSRQALAERAGVDVRRVRDLLGCADRNYRALTLASLSRALEWAPGHLAALLAGEPVPDAPPERDPSGVTLDEVMARLEEIETVLRFMVRNLPGQPQ